jgi:adenylate cyclase
MAEERTQRRLAAILAADVVGYSRLMEVDEAGTLAALKARRKDVLEPLVGKHQGRVFKVTGDGVLIEFASAVNAVQCAVELQQGMAAANSGQLENRQILLRIGVNLGDVIVEGGDRYGDGVNIAARLEGIAEPGGILLSGTTYDHVRNKIDATFEDVGVQSLKNIADPVRVHRVVGTPRVSAGMVKAATDKPSIAVLPFANMSGDPEQEYFTDGITEDIITELSRFRSLFVIARNSSFQYRDKATDVRRIGRELGAQYVLEGSVRRAGDRLRVTAQLIEAASGNHLWAERYDRELKDIFALQDEVTRAISAAIPGQLDRLAVEHLRRKPPKNLTAYDCELRGRWAFFHLAEGLAVALSWYEKAVEADPTYALAHAGLGMTSVFGVLSLGLTPEPTLARGREHARKAVALDETNPTVNCYAAFTYHISGDHRLTRKHAERAVSLNPNDPFAIYVLGCALSYTGEPEQALEWFARSERLEPYAPDDQRLDTLCDCYYMLRNYAKVIEIHEVYQNVPAFLYLVLAAAYAQAGQTEKAAAAVKSYERLRPPGHDLKTHITYWMKMCSRQSDRDHWMEGFRKAGMDV